MCLAMLFRQGSFRQGSFRQGKTNPDSSLYGRCTGREGALRQAGAVAIMTGFLAACSAAPDWAKLDAIYGDEAAEAASQTTEDEADFPNISGIADRPIPSATAVERQKLAASLSADRAQARYTDEVLRGGTEPSAPAPKKSVANTPAVLASPVLPEVLQETPNSLDDDVILMPGRGGRSSIGGMLNDAVRTEVPALVAMATAEVMRAEVPAPVAPAALDTVRAEVPAPVAPVALDTVRAEVPAPVATAALDTVRAETPAPVAPAALDTVRAETPAPVATEGKRPAVPPLASGNQRGRTMVSVPSDSVEAPVDDRPVDDQIEAAPRLAVAPPAATRPSSQFERSQAPQLSPEALDTAGDVVASRYRQTHNTVFIGGPDEQDVRINLEVLEYAPPGPGAALPRSHGVLPEEFTDQGGVGNVPPFVVYFAHGSSALLPAGREVLSEVKNVLGDYEQSVRGQRVRILGHASSRTANLALDEHKLANFKISYARAQAVTEELIRQGIPAENISAEAVGDTVPVYYESMPVGEAGNRRVEIFIE